MDSAITGPGANFPDGEFPPPAIPDHPVLSREATRGARSASLPSVLDAGACVHGISGRTALASGLIHLGIGEGDRVLLPAYHCTAIVEPVVWRGATPDFYRVNADTTVDLEDVVRRITPSTRAILAIHYFGFPQAMARLRALCDEKGLLLIEDCAHAFFGTEIGKQGDIAIASTWKFFPLLDGGCLVSGTRDLSAVPSAGHATIYEAKSILNTLERGWMYGRLSFSKALLSLPLAARSLFRRRGRGAGVPGAAPREAPRGSPTFQSYWVGKRPSRMSARTLRRASFARVVEARRAHYLTLERELANLPGARPLFPELPEGVVPYVFPMLFDEPERHFAPLKRQGVPIVRFGEILWPGVDASTCPVAADYSRRVFQFPCHQELRPEELSWLIDRVREALDPRKNA